MWNTHLLSVKLECFRYKFFLKDGLIGTFRDARTTVDAGVRVDVEPGPIRFWLPTNDAVHRANVHAGAVS
jgi:hypothetical protein